MAVDYGQSYSDKKTQSLMMRFLKKSNQYTGSRRLGNAAPKTSMNKQPRAKNDFFDNPRLQAAAKGSPVGSNKNERVSETPMRIRKRLEKQNNTAGPRITKKSPPPKTSRVNRRYK